MKLLSNIAKLVTLEGAVQKKGRNITSEDLSIIENAALVYDKKIIWAGEEVKLPTKYKKLKKTNAQKKMVIPGFIDSHTHLVFAGNRSRDLEQSLSGKTYQEIAAAGGGITHTTQATREISQSDLLKLSDARLKNALKQGITTLEIKTGYGLSFEAEKKCLDVIHQLQKKSPQTIKATYLAAHALPPEYKNRKSEYVTLLTHEWLPKLKSKIDFVDMFIDEGYFDLKDADTLFNSTQLPIKIHADELALSGGTRKAVEYKALSADHLLKITDSEINLLAQSEVTATLLPTTAFYLKTNYASARKLLDAGARVALATDYNPGTSPTQDISLVGILSALYMNMRSEEILVGLTLNGAYALGLEKTKGALLPGYDADFLITKGESVAHIFYEFGQKPLNYEVIIKGQKVK
ncbi:MAG: imidazolonepropionase [Oligoflexia bacterium]|nr:imidazolonepropionase [Oligoflexia bacterium]